MKSPRLYLVLALLVSNQLAALPCFGQTNVVRTGLFARGTGTNTTHQSFVLPLDFQKGVVLDNLNGNATNLFPSTGTNYVFGPTRYHFDATRPASATNNALRITYNNPIVAFGARVGGSPLYFNEDYHFGAYAGATAPYSDTAMYIAVYSAADYHLVDSVPLLIPALEYTNAWRNFLTNGYQATFTTYGLTTTLRFDDPSKMWGVDFGAGCYHIIHNATQTASNYVYVVILSGYTDGSWMTTDADGYGAWSRMYSLEFQQRPPWRAVFLDQPQFSGISAPSFYYGKSLPELLTNAPPVTNVISLAPSACTNLDASPELRRHPVLDQFVLDLRRNPLALANYVQNEIKLTDPLAYNDNGAISDVSINLGGVNRSALGTFLEKQGSPVEQCALLIYLLRQAGIPAAYVFPAENGLKLLDTQLSDLLGMQIRGAFNFSPGANNQPYTTNSLIAVNYPWVAAYIGGNWVHLFPWLKDTGVVEGLNLYNYMPANYKTSYQWVRDYLHGKPNIMSLSSSDDTPQTLFPLFVKQVLATNAPGVSLEEIGVQLVDRRHLFARWTDFPRPPVVTNAVIAVESLGSSAITNVNPRLTNIFDTVSVTVSSVANPGTKLTTGTLRLTDLHNRKFLIRHEKISSSSHRMIMTLEPYRSGTSGIGAFSNDADLLKQQSVTNTLGSSDDALIVRFVFNRHRALPNGFVPPTDPVSYLGLAESLSITNDRPMRKGDLAAICLNLGQVTPQMLQVHAQELWDMERALRANPSATNGLSPDVYQGAVAYLMGMAYHEKVGRFEVMNQNLHKVRVMSQLTFGMAGIRAARNTSGQLPSGNIDLVQPYVDMFAKEVVMAGNTTIHADSGDAGNVPNDDYFHLAIADSSAQEHSIINHFFNQTDAVSTVKLLQMAQAKSATNGQPGILTLDYFNYQAEGNKNYPTTGTTKLRSQLPLMWARITNAFAAYASTNENYVQVFITPGPVTNQTASFKGMAALIIQPGGATAAIAEKNGGWGANNPAGSLGLANSPNISLTVDSANNYSISLAQPGSGNITLAPDIYAGYNSGSVVNNASLNYYNFTADQANWSGAIMDYMGLTSQGSQNLNFAQAVQAAEGNNGFFGWLSDALSQAGTRVVDPVHAVTGEFYINATDLALPGPMPLAVNRNYSSLNLADNQFGYGWKLDYMPYLSINSAATVIFAAEPDGSVLAYEKTATNANVFLPTPAKNPQLNNNTSAGIGSVANRFQNRIDKQVVGADTFYYLVAPDGSKRFFKVMTFTGAVNQTRPYLTRWEDSRGNFFSFEYGTDPSQPDYGQARRIQSSNGNYFGFYFDVYGHVVEAYAGDGRRLSYEYDQFGDLVKVTLPDASEIQYEYEHKTQLVNGKQTPYSTHLVTQEIKPDGRVIKNEYDQHRRVTNQWATVGADLRLVRNATFIYSNNFNLTNSFTNTITGFTLVKDVNDNTNRYDYTNGLLTKITDALNQSIIQDWYEPSETAKAGYYPRSLESRTDKRGLVTYFKYDSNGNVTNTLITGDLTGEGGTQSATNIVAYNLDNLPTLSTDPAGNKVQTIYHPQYRFLPEYVVRLAGSTPVSTNRMVYGGVTNIFVSGGFSYTNCAKGVLLQEVRAFGSPDAATNEWVRDGRGFITQSVRRTGTADPAVTNSFLYSDRGEVVEQMDVLGRRTRFEYDGLGRPIAREVFEAGQAVPLAWEYSYYSENGELTWSDGPRFDPEDYVWRDYDGAGRLITEIHWRSQARADGSGMEAPSGDELFATSFRQYDAFGNLTKTIDPRGGVTTNIWDKLGRLAQRKSLDFDGSTVLSSEGFGYEPGGLVRFHTNALGGVSETQYTTNGLPKFRRNADGSTNAWRYYLDGRMKREIQGNGAYWETTYDDANRKTTRIFYTASGTAQATNATVLDRRDNAIQQIDAGANVFTNLFDGLDRLKIAAGPPVVTSSFDPLTGQTTTNVLQQCVTNFYDASGLRLTNVNALGEKTITTTDALGRATRVEIRSPSNQLVRETDTIYTPNHSGRMVTQGSGAAAMESYHFSDNAGQDALDLVFSSQDRMEYTLRYFDVGGLPTNETHVTFENGSYTADWARHSGHDALGRLATRVDRDDAYTYFFRDAMGNVTNRVMPGGLQWRATYNNAGQITKEWNVGGTSGTRTNTYAYFASGSPFAGLLQTRTDNRGVTSTLTYDAWLRPATNSYTGSLAEQNLTTVWQYDRRGLVTNITEQFASSATGPATAVRRRFDAYGLVASESVMVGGNTFTSALQGFDAAGRRTTLGLGSGYIFGWQADGSLAAVALNQFGSASYTYTTGGLLTNRLTGGRSTTVSSRDGAGRPLSVTTAVNAVTKVTENLTWTGDGLLATHTMARAGDFTDSRQYFYGVRNRRLTEERLNLDASRRWTNIYTFDNGSDSGPGVLTRIGQTASASTWSGVKDAFSRVGTETNTYSRQTAFGKLNGLANVSLTLDNVPVSFAVVGTASQQWPYQWRATLELQPGAHRLDAKAVHTSGLFTNAATSWFTNNVGALSVTNLHDGNGNLTQRIWRKANGTTNLLQTLAWDARGRLYKVTERDGSQSGRDFTITYDPLGRRLRTVETAVTNNVVLTNSPLVVDHYFDPQVEFLELGLNEGGKTTWKLIGPDLDGQYGGQNGTGGLEATASGMTFTPLIADAFGNVLASVNGGSVSWSSSRVSAYGAVPGYRPPSIGIGNVGLECAWRNRAADSIGFVWLGGNWLDPVGGRFISFDPLGHEASDSGYSFCGGNPVGYIWDADGRLGKGAFNYAYNGGAVGESLRALGGYLSSYDNSSTAGGWFSGFSGAIVNEMAGMSAPSTYVNGLSSYGHNVAGYDNDGGLLPATSYALTSWNVGAIYSGAANFDLHYDTAGHEVGDWYQRSAVISGGVANTAGIAAGGLGLFNWATAAPANAVPIATAAQESVFPGPNHAPVSGYTWNQNFQARYGAASVEWVAPKLPSEPLTLGALRTPVGEFELASGWNGYGGLMPKGARGFDIVTRTHVEGQAAALMQKQAVNEGLLYINNPVICGSCTRNLPSMLGPGRSLQVVPVNGGTVPFTGGAR